MLGQYAWDFEAKMGRPSSYGDCSTKQRQEVSELQRIHWSRGNYISLNIINRVKKGVKSLGVPVIPLILLLTSTLHPQACTAKVWNEDCLLGIARSSRSVKKLMSMKSSPKHCWRSRRRPLLAGRHWEGGSRHHLGPLRRQCCRMSRVLRPMLPRMSRQASFLLRLVVGPVSTIHLHLHQV